MSFANEIFVVTGANSGIGYNTAKYLVSEGAKVYITGRNAEAIAKAGSDLGPNVVAVVADTASIADSVKLAETIASNGEELDGLFVNAGIIGYSAFAEVTEDFFDTLFNTNIKGTYFTIQKLLPVLRDGSSVVISGSYYVEKCLPTSSVVTASKAAINSLAKTLSRDLLPRKIRVNVVNPGPVVTPIFEKSGFSNDILDAWSKQVVIDIPVGRLGHVDDITGYVAYLLSDKSTFVLGTALTIDGGYSHV